MFILSVSIYCTRTGRFQILNAHLGTAIHELLITKLKKQVLHRHYMSIIFLNILNKTDKSKKPA